MKTPLPLVCPFCRVPGPDGRLVVVRLEPSSPDGLRCAGCGQVYPVVDGVACVPPDLDAFRGAQAEALAGRPGLDAAGARAGCDAAMDLDPASRAFREAVLPGQYVAAHHPGAPALGPLADDLACNDRLFERIAGWVDRHAPAGGRRRALDAGCSAGRLSRVLAARYDVAAGLDLRLSVLRVARRLADAGRVAVPFRVEGGRFEPLEVEVPAGPAPAWVQGDVYAPPFEAGSFDLVAALSLVDTVPDPLFVLGQLDALVAPGGLLLLASPYQWEAEVTPPPHWWADRWSTGEEVLRAALAGHLAGLPHLAYEVLEEAPRAAFALPGGRRMTFRYALDVVLARKATASSPGCS